MVGDRRERSAHWPSASQRFLDQWSTGAQQAAAQRGLAQLRQLDFTLHYPAYLNRSPEQLLGSDGELEVPEGTEVELTVTPVLHASQRPLRCWSMACAWCLM